jgi:hypothetical protein
MPELLRSAKLAVEKGQAQGRDESYVKQLSDFIIPALVEALHKVVAEPLSLTLVIYFTHCLNANSLHQSTIQEPETEMCSSMLDSLNECMQVCAVYVVYNTQRSVWLHDLSQVSILAGVFLGPRFQLQTLELNHYGQPSFHSVWIILRLREPKF